jgi:uncharacterized membrane protein
MVNPGFHKGPWLPIYGVSGLMIVLVSGVLNQKSLILRIVFYFILSSGVELSSGIFLERVFHKHYWDYTANRWNIAGHICPLYSCGWVFICLVVEYFLLPGLFELIKMIPEEILFSTDLLLLLVFSADFMISSGIEHGKTRNILKKAIVFINSNWKHGL